MRRVLVLAFLALLAIQVSGAGGTRSYPRRTAQALVKRRAGHAGTVRCVGCERDRNGRIARSERARQAFRKTNPCPSTGRTSGPCPGYQIDHRQPLYKGGLDSAGNMQWLSADRHKAKHRKR